MEFQTEGIIFWITAWSTVITLVVYCYVRVLRSKDK